MTEQVWGRLETWAQENAPEILAVLNPGAADATLAELQRKLGLGLPEELGASLRRHEGQRFAEPFLFGGGYLLDAADIAEEWNLSLELSQGDDPTMHWQRNWIPFVGRDGDYLHVRAGGDGDLVWTYEHEAERAACLDVTVGGWLELWLDDLTAGRLAPGGGTFAIRADARCWPTGSRGGQSPVQ